MIKDERGIEVYEVEKIRMAVLNLIKERGLMNADDPELLDGTIADLVIDYLRDF